MELVEVRPHLLSPGRRALNRSLRLSFPFFSTAPQLRPWRLRRRPSAARSAPSRSRARLSPLSSRRASSTSTSPSTSRRSSVGSSTTSSSRPCSRRPTRTSSSRNWPSRVCLSPSPPPLPPRRLGTLMLRRSLPVHRRNVVFFKNQREQLTDSELKTLARKLGQLTGGEGRLHIHPTEIDREDNEISPIKATELCVFSPSRSLARCKP